MDEIKKAFKKLDEKKLSDEKKQEIFDRVIDAHASADMPWKKRLFIAVPVFAACVIAAAVFLLPGIMKPDDKAGEMVILEKPADELFDDMTAALDEPEIVSTVILSLNPVVEFGLDAQGQVLEVKGLDGDGEKLLAGIDCTGLSFENAAIVVVNQLLLNDYISSSVGEASITVSVESEQMGVESLDVVADTINTAAVQNNMQVEVEASEQEQELSIVLTGGQKPEDANLPEGVQITLEFELSRTKAGTVDNVDVYSQYSNIPLGEIDFSDMTYKEAVLYSVSELIDMGLISAEKNNQVFMQLSEADETRLDNLMYLTELIISQSGLPYEVVLDGGQAVMRPAPESGGEQPKLSMSQILDPAVRKNIDELTKTQMDILGLVYTEEQIEELLAVRYWVVVPNLIGLEEQKAVALLEQMGIVPVVTREYNEEYSQFEEGTVFFQDFNPGVMLEKGDRFQIFVLADIPNPLGEGWTPSVYSEIDTNEDAGIEAEYAIYISGTGELYIKITSYRQDGGLGYDTDFTLERLFEGQWYSAVRTEGFEPLARNLDAGYTAGERIDLGFAGELEDGRYRIVKNIGGSRYSAEFEIAQDGYSSDTLSGYMPLEDLTQEYTLEEAVGNHDLVTGSDSSVHNEDKLIEFIENAGMKIPCKVRQTAFTDAGDALIYDIVFTGKYYYVVSDTTRDESGPQETVVQNYSYISLNYTAQGTKLVLANSHMRLAAGTEYKNTGSFELLEDIGIIQSADIESIVLDMIDETAPLKVYSPDGEKYVTYTDGRKTVGYEVGGQYAGGIILAGDNEEGAGVIALEWRDDNVVLITCRAADGSYTRTAFDVVSEEIVPLSEEEAASLGSIDEEYFTDKDMQELTEQFIQQAESFVLTLSDEDGTRIYSIDGLTAAASFIPAGGEEQVLVSLEWDRQTLLEFMTQVVGYNVLDWSGVYEGEGPDGSLEWSLEIVSGGMPLSSYGTGAYPDEFEALILLAREYFGQQG